MMITEENLDSDCREIHYVSENGRVEGLILNKTPIGIEDSKRKRPRSAKAGRRTISRDGRMSVAGDLTYRPLDVESINEKGVHELFSDILYDSDDNPVDYKDDFEDDVDDENNWSDDSPHPYSVSASSLTSRSENFQYHTRPSSQYIPQSQIPVPESPSIVSGVKYNEWQRNSGLRVLRKVMDRQKLLEFESLNFASNGGGGKSKDDFRHLPRLKMKKRPLKLQPLSGEVNLQEETGRRLSESLISRISSGTMKGV